MNKTLVALGVQGEEELQAWSEIFKADRRKVGMFREPDRHNEMTALAVEASAAGDLARVGLL